MRNVLREDAHLFDSDRGLGTEFDPNGADAGFWVWVRAGRKRSVFLQHGGCRASGESHFFATGLENVRGFTEI